MNASLSSFANTIKFFSVAELLSVCRLVPGLQQAAIHIKNEKFKRALECAQEALKLDEYVVPPFRSLSLRDEAHAALALAGRTRRPLSGRLKLG